MKIAYFDCFHGAAGDMLIASLLDAGLEVDALRGVLAKLPVTGYTLDHTYVMSHHVRGSRFHVHVNSPQPERSWTEIRALLEASALPPLTCARAYGTFERLARVEARIHGVALDEVHFHEIGAVDSIVDIVGVCAGLELLGIEHVYASPLPPGRGWVMTQHGLLPVPAPATLALLAEVGAPLVPVPAASEPGELLTPTAAALLAQLAHFDQPAMHVQQVGYGFGQREFTLLNGLRVWIGTLADNARPSSVSVERRSIPVNDHHHHHHHHQAPTPLPTPDPVLPTPELQPPTETVIELRCNLDDVTGEVIAYTIERLLAVGALDAWSTPLVMKKGRPAVQLSCLAHPANVQTLANVILHETPTLGVRWEHMQRVAVERQVVQVKTPWGQVRLKQKIINGSVASSAPEYEDCAALARTHAVPLSQVYAAALASGQFPTSYQPEDQPDA